jgi:hypothetical protein
MESPFSTSEGTFGMIKEYVPIISSFIKQGLEEGVY